MSVSIYVVAQKQLSKEDFEKITLHNGLIENGYNVPTELVDELKATFDIDDIGDEPISLPDGIQAVEIHLGGRGSVMYGDGLVIPVSNIPINTVALRIYAD